MKKFITISQKTLYVRIFDKKASKTRLSKFLKSRSLLVVNNCFKNESNAVFGVLLQRIITVFILILISMQFSIAQNTESDKEIIQLSKDKWQWMSDKDVDKLSKLFHEKAVFVHMGGAWGTEQELNIIKEGGIWYKKADIHEVSVNIIDNTAILLNRIDLLAEVGGNEVTNPFEVTEVYIKQGDNWMLGSLSFTKLLTPGGH